MEALVPLVQSPSPKPEPVSVSLFATTGLLPCLLPQYIARRLCFLFFTMSFFVQNLRHRNNQPCIIVFHATESMSFGTTTDTCLAPLTWLLQHWLAIENNQHALACRSRPARSGCRVSRVNSTCQAAEPHSVHLTPRDPPLNPPPFPQIHLSTSLPPAAGLHSLRQRAAHQQHARPPSPI